MFEPEGSACSFTDSTAEEHVVALVEHSADEARDRINRYMPNSKVSHHSHCHMWEINAKFMKPRKKKPNPFIFFQMGFLRKEPDTSILYTVVNQLDPDAEGW